MRAAVRGRYGPPDVLQVSEIPRPVPGEGEVLVRVRAAAVNPLDWHAVTGLPYIARGAMGLRRPKQAVAGVDVSGVVESVGTGVTTLRTGDEVFGGCRGAFAEYAVAKQEELAAKPARLSFDEAAAVPVAAVTALQALRDQGRLRAGQAMLINGASGGVGLFAVQIAKHLGVEVTGVCSSGNVELVRSAGADRVIDYTREDFTRKGRRYDLLLDNAGNHSLAELRRALTARGTLISNTGGGEGRWLGPVSRILRVKATSPFVRQELRFFLAKLNRADLDHLRELIDAGAVRVVIERTYELAQTAEAIRQLGGGHVRSKLVITVAGSPT